MLEYFEGNRTKFDIPLSIEVGTEFQKLAWAALLEIPYGDVNSYGEQALRMGKSKSASRAVGVANSKNPLAIIIPCHRVIGASGDLVGFGAGLKTKLHLLKMEESFNKGKNPFQQFRFQ